MSKKKVGVVCGGFSSEFEISVLSGKTVFLNLDRDLFEVYLITIRPDVWTAVDDYKTSFKVSKGDFSLISDNHNVKLDVIFNMIHGAPGENGQPPIRAEDYL